MKRIILSLFILVVGVNMLFAESKADVLQKFVQDFVAIDASQLTSAEPIAQLATILLEKADKSISISKSTISEALAEGKNFSKVIIVVGKHTVIIVENFDDCKQSGAWGACMPLGTSLIQKSGSFTQKEDYINNLMGIPDTQERKMFLFK